MTGTSCLRCGATIRFIRTRAGKAMPVNPVPDRTGNVAATHVGRGKYIDGHVITANEPVQVDEIRFRPHYADCRDAPAEAAPKPEPQPDLFTEEP